MPQVGDFEVEAAKEHLVGGTARNRTVSRATKARAARVFVAASEKCGRDDVPQWVRELAQEDPNHLTEADITEVERAAVIWRVRARLNRH